MKGKLIKTGNDYLLKDTNGEVLAITNGVTEGKKLSKQNCDEIFGVVYVEKLADEYANVNGDYDEHYGHIGFKAGFKKAMELNKNKVFTLEDIKKAINWAWRKTDRGEHILIIDEHNFIQSLRESTEIDVEIKMEPCFYDQSLGGFSTSYTEDKPKEQPKLDSEGCLILKKL
jgi:hypothetical protein